MRHHRNLRQKQRTPHPIRAVNGASSSYNRLVFNRIKKQRTQAENLRKVAAHVHFSAEEYCAERSVRSCRKKCSLLMTRRPR
jgi:hypothetical protein